MYEELIDTLRETADKRMHEAADAIEELSKPTTGGRTEKSLTMAKNGTLLSGLIISESKVESSMRLFSGDGRLMKF